MIPSKEWDFCVSAPVVELTHKTNGQMLHSNQTVNMQSDNSHPAHFFAPIKPKGPIQTPVKGDNGKNDNNQAHDNFGPDLYVSNVLAAESVKNTNIRQPQKQEQHPLVEPIYAEVSKKNQSSTSSSFQVIRIATSPFRLPALTPFHSIVLV